MSILSLTLSPFVLPNAQVNQEGYEEKPYDGKERPNNRIRFFAAQTIHAFWMDARTG